MNLRCTIPGLILALTCIGGTSRPLPGVNAAGGATQKPAAPKGHALLVGCSRYPNLEERYQLQGPANDVLLMRDLLVKHFGFAPANIALLAEHAGQQRLPTRANIEKEFRRLAAAAKPGDQVVIFMAGHGSQQPEGPNPKEPEPDGLDEIFLPRDVAGWDGSTGKVKNAIIDDELGEWLAAIRARGAFVWVVIDACHSGTMIRGAGERERQLNPEAALGIPRAALKEAQARAARRGAGKEATRGGPAVAHRPLAAEGGVVAVYACQDNEVTVEMELPASSSDARPYGLMTYTIGQVLTQAATNGRPLTYRELVQRIHAQYVRLGRSAPTPQIEGRPEDRDREVLGKSVWAGRSRIALSRDGDDYKVNAGALHGLTEGTILAVYPAADEKGDGKPVGHVKVARLKTLTALAEPCAFEGAAAPKSLPASGRCEVVQVDYGMDRLRVVLDPRDTRGEPLGAAAKAKASAALGQLGKEAAAVLQIGDDPAKADWIVRLGGDEAFLTPAAEYVRAAPGKRPALFGPYKLDARLVPELKESLGKIARAEAIKRLAAAPADGLARARGGADAGVQFEVEVLRFAGENDRKGVPLKWEGEGLTLHRDDIVGLRVRNASRFPVDLTVLYVNADYGIDAWFPDGGEINRLRPGEAQLLPRMVITASTLGLENVVLIGVRGSGKEEADFTSLSQPPLKRAGIVARGKESLRTPLGNLLRTALDGEGNTRGIRRTAVETYALRLLPWRVVPAKR